MTELVHNDVVLIGGGVGSLTAAALLAGSGRSVTVLEHNHVAGGCASSFYRQGYWFESGATTLVGLDAGMPLRHVLDRTGIRFDVIALETPMQVHLADGTAITRHQNLNAWIDEAERVFGPRGQRAFWEFCYDVSRFVWDTSLLYPAFPPSNFRDVFDSLPRVRPAQLLRARFAFQTMQTLLRNYDLLSNARFVAFVNEQLMITAQNTIEEDNVLFGATALCYTNYTNYYVPGGLIRMVNAFSDYIRAHASQVVCRTTATAIKRDAAGRGFQIATRTPGVAYTAPCVISGIPIHNTLELLDDARFTRRYAQRALPSHKLWSAFTMGLVFRAADGPDGSAVGARNSGAPARPPVLHHQIHLDRPLPGIGARSIFLSLSHADDRLRGPDQHTIASISTHIPDPERNESLDVAAIESAIIQTLVERGFVAEDRIVYRHSSTPRTWLQWTRRKFGQVGGHPQYRKIKPWRMIDARLCPGLYQCGDTAYPGQGIPGACLSGIIAHHKLSRDYGDFRAGSA